MINNYFPGYTGQQEYQAFVDEEEERRRREQEMAMPVKQTIETDPETGAQKVKIEGSAYNLSAANPLTPTVTAPVSPDQLSQLPTQQVSAQPVTPVQAPPPEPLPPQPQVPSIPEPLPVPQMQQPPAAPISPAQSAQMQPPPAPAPAPAAVQMQPTGVGPSAEGTAGEAEAQSNMQRQQQAFLAAQGDPTRLTMLAQTETIHPMIRSMAQDRLADMYSQQRAEQQARQDLATKSPTEVARMMQARDQEGSWGRAILFGLLGMENAARDESAKLGIGARWSTQDMNGQPVMIKMRADGVPMEGYNAATGERLSTQELTAAAGNVGQKLGIVGGTYVNDRTGEVGRVVTDEKTGRTWVQTDSGRKSMAGFRPQASTGTLDMQRIAQIQKQNIDLAGDWAKLQMKVQGAGPEAANRFLGEFNAKHRMSVPMESINGAAPQISLETGQMTTGAPPPAAATAAPQATAAAPQAAAPAAPRAGGGVSIGGGGVPTRGAPSPAQVEQNMALNKKAAESGIETAQQQNQERNTSNQKYSDQMSKDRQSALAQKSTINRLQTSIDKNPNFWGIDTNSPTWRAFVDVNSSNENRAAALNTLARNLNIPADKRTEFDSVMNDYRNLELSAITGSGLTASQTNSEGESRRVVGTVGNISDRPLAARAALEYAQAKVQYADEKARAWVQARRSNPRLDRLEFEIDFDANQGEKIFQDANQRMEKIIAGQGGGAPKPGFEKDGWIFQGGDPANKNNWKKKP